MTNDQVREAAVRCVSWFGENSEARIVAAAWLHEHPIDDTICLDSCSSDWWKGHHHTVGSMCEIINAILDGKEDSRGVCAEPWQSTRLRLLKLVEQVKGGKAS